jgi:hypothetical protein
MNTAFLLMAQYDGQAIIPLETVRRDYFPNLTLPTLLNKLNRGEIALPVTRMEASQKATKGIHLGDLAAYIDARREAGQRELRQLVS